MALSSIGFAQRGFAGPALLGLYFPNVDGTTDLTFFFLGGQVGSYNVFGPLGARATIDFSVSPISGALLGSADVLFASSGDTKVYGGVGLGIFSFFGISAPFGKAFVGSDFAIADSVSLFVEAAPLYAFQTSNIIFGGRAGVNFAFGQ